jgi:hypothetical protein
MAARNWTQEQRTKQAEAIGAWKPWQRSTGARTAEGKAKISRNSCRPPTVRMLAFTRWMIKQLAKAQTGKPSATIEEVKQRAIDCGVKL